MKKEKRILIVDDDRLSVMALKKILGNHDFKTFCAYNGNEALESLSENPDINIILLDLVMPELNGIKTFSKLKTNEKFKDIPIIVLTARVLKEEKEWLEKNGCFAYLEKPFDMEKLFELINQLYLN
ncbi:MAG: response regulator [Flavobacteriia bacterium]|nr:response regulator [Flavobacteriia bacterium]